jgi:hypothetical protein
MAALRATRSSFRYGFATRALPSTPWRRFGGEPGSVAS